MPPGSRAVRANGSFATVPGSWARGVEGGGGLGVESLYLLILSDLGDNYRNFTGLAGEANVSSGEARDGGVAPHGCPLLLFRQDLFQPRT